MDYLIRMKKRKRQVEKRTIISVIMFFLFVMGYYTVVFKKPDVIFVESILIIMLLYFAIIVFNLHKCEKQVEMTHMKRICDMVSAEELREIDDFVCHVADTLWFKGSIVHMQCVLSEKTIYGWGYGTADFYCYKIEDITKIEIKKNLLYITLQNGEEKLIGSYYSNGRGTFSFKMKDFKEQIEKRFINS